VRSAARPDNPLEALALVAGQVPTPLFDGYAGFMAARTLMAGCSLGVFRALAELQDTADGLATRLRLDPLGTDALLVSLHTMGYLEQSADGVYRNARVVERWVFPLEPYLGVFTYDMWETWSSLEETVRTGRPAGLHERPDDDPHWERYMRGLFALAEMAGPDVARAVGAREPRTLLDVAGGHGGFSIALCRRHAGLRATVLELEGAARIGRELVAEAGFADRVRYRVADMLEDPLGDADASEFDVVFLGQILHHLSPEDCVRLLVRSREVLAGGGVLAVYEQERPKPGARGHQIGVLTGLMFYAYSRARTYSADEISGFLREAGFPRVKVKRPLRLAGTMIHTARG
jgi:SAM-dependent methyltransferase